MIPSGTYSWYSWHGLKPQISDWGGWMVLWSYAKKARAIDDPRKRPLFRSFSGNSKTTYSISKRIRQRVFIIEEGVWLHVSGACHGMTICSMVFLTYSMLLYCLYLTNVQCMNDHAWQYLNWHLPILHQKLLWVCKPCCSIHFHLPDNSSETWRIETPWKSPSSKRAPSPSVRTTTICRLRWSTVQCWGAMGTVSQWACHGEPILFVSIAKLGFLA